LAENPGIFTSILNFTWSGNNSLAPCIKHKWKSKL